MAQGCLQCACRHFSIISPSLFSCFTRPCSCLPCSSLTVTSRPLPTTTSLTLTSTTSCRTFPTEKRKSSALRTRTSCLAIWPSPPSTQEDVTKCRLDHDPRRSLANCKVNFAEKVSPHASVACQAGSRSNPCFSVRQIFVVGSNLLLRGAKEGASRLVWRRRRGAGPVLRDPTVTLSCPSLHRFTVTLRTPFRFEASGSQF